MALPDVAPTPSSNASADRQRETVRFGDAVELEYYRLQQVSSGAIQLGEDDDAQVVGPSAVGTGTSDEPTAPLSEIIQQLNDRFGTRFTEADRLFFEQIERDPPHLLCLFENQATDRYPDHDEKGCPRLRKPRAPTRTSLVAYRGRFCISSAFARAASSSSSR